MANSAVFQMADEDMDLLDVVPDLPEFDEALEEVTSDPHNDSLSASFINIFGECDPFNLNDSGTFSVDGDDEAQQSLFGLDISQPVPAVTAPNAPVKRTAANVMDAAVDMLLREATANLRHSTPRKSLVSLEQAFATNGLAIPAAPDALEDVPTRALVVPSWDGSRRRESAASSIGSARSPESDAASVSPPASPVYSPYEGSVDRRTQAHRLKNASTNPRHAQGRNHVCPQCLSRFLCKSKLDRHMLTHSGIKPFPCFCGKRFNQKSALKNHTRRHLKKKNAPSDINVETQGLNGFSYQALVQ
eukprot:m.452145 g.452145  ORF g.452145 m.452145 type:complete len:303 (-) comp20276_c0_seq1:144-1052(-)